MKIRFYVNGEKPKARAAEQVLRETARRYGLEVAADAADAAEVAITLGGDGTILRAVHELPGVPLLGFNLGGLGYLASVSEAEFDDALAALSRGAYRLSQRSLLEVCKVGGESCSYRALNDVAVVREMSGHAARLDLSVDGRIATRYMADGLIFATPTGSTAYSLAAGGPVLLPDTASFVITPMNPHALAVRPMVVRDGARFRVAARARRDGEECRVGVYADGAHVFSLEPGETAEVAKAAATAPFVELEGYNPHDVLARKLGWSGSRVE